MIDGTRLTHPLHHAFRAIADVVHGFIVHVGKHGTSLLAAALAFYAMFSLFPLLLLLISIAGYVLPTYDIDRSLGQILQTYAPSAGRFVHENLISVVQARASTGLIGLVALLWSGSNVFSVLTGTLNRIWESPHRRMFLLRRAVGLLAVFGAGLVLLGSLVFATLTTSVSHTVADEWGLAGWATAHLLQVLSEVAFPGATFIIIVLSYRFLPTHRPPWVPIILAAMLVTAAMQVARYAFAWYVTSLSTYTLVYGSLTTFVVLMLWIYIIAWLYLHGAELASVLSRPPT